MPREQDGSPKCPDLTELERPIRPPLDHRRQPSPGEHWHLLIGDQTNADAILDRLVHDATRIDLTGESLSKKTRNAHAER